MRQVTNQLAIGLLLQQKPLFVGNFQLLIQWPQLDQRQPASASIGVTDRAICSGCSPCGVRSSRSCSI
jgi:hypothetical protein